MKGTEAFSVAEKQSHFLGRRLCCIHEAISRGSVTLTATLCAHKASVPTPSHLFGRFWQSLKSIVKHLRALTPCLAKAWTSRGYFQATHSGAFPSTGRILCTKTLMGLSAEYKPWTSRDSIGRYKLHPRRFHSRSRVAKKSCPNHLRFELFEFVPFHCAPGCSLGT